MCDSVDSFPSLWTQLFRVMDDVHEGTRQAAGNTTKVVSKVCNYLLACDDCVILSVCLLYLVLTKGVQSIKNKNFINFSGSIYALNFKIIFQLLLVTR